MNGEDSAELAACASIEVGDVADTQEAVEQKQSKSGCVQGTCVTHEVLQPNVGRAEMV